MNGSVGWSIPVSSSGPCTIANPRTLGELVKDVPVTVEPARPPQHPQPQQSRRDDLSGTVPYYAALSETRQPIPVTAEPVPAPMKPPSNIVEEAPQSTSLQPANLPGVCVFTFSLPLIPSALLSFLLFPRLSPVVSLSLFIFLSLPFCLCVSFSMFFHYILRRVCHAQGDASVTFYACLHSSQPSQFRSAHRCENCGVKALLLSPGGCGQNSGQWL